MDLKEEDLLGEAIDAHWYYVSKGRALRDFLGDIRVPELLDVGAGSGIFSRQLLDAGLCERAVCVDPNYENERSERHNGRPIDFVRAVEQTTQRLVLMMDVLEHVEDDAALLKSYAQSMVPGGLVLITVPAFQFMWSGHDVFLEHHRRYTLASVEDCVRKAGLTPVKGRYFFGALFPAIATLRLLKNALRAGGGVKPSSDLSVSPPWLNRLLIITHDVERHTVFAVNRLFGLSVFCLCRKD